MTAEQIVDSIIDAGEFMSDFPMKRAGTNDVHRVLSNLLRLKNEKGGWGGDIAVTVDGGFTPEKWLVEHPADYQLETYPYIDFDCAVMTHDGRLVGQDTKIDTDDSFFGWVGFLSFDPGVVHDNDSSVHIHVSYGVNSCEHGFNEEIIPPEAMAACVASFNKFNLDYIQPSLWLNESSRYYARKKKLKSAETSDVAEFYRAFAAGVQPGELISDAGSLAAYTHDWPEYDSWVSYGMNFHDNDERWAFYSNPDQWKGCSSGSVRYESKDFRLKGQKSAYRWLLEWQYGSSYNFARHVTISIERYDHEGGHFWQSHWKKPVMWAYKKNGGGPLVTQADWDAADPEKMEITPLDQPLKDKIVADAKLFLEKLGKIARIDKVRWNIPELYVAESTDNQEMLDQLGKVAANTAYVRASQAFYRASKDSDDEYAWQVALMAVGVSKSDASIVSEYLTLCAASYYDHGDDGGVREEVMSLLVNDAHLSVDDAYHFFKFWRHYLNGARAEKRWGAAFGRDVTEARNRQSTKGYELIGGDVSGWKYGATWHNAETGDIVHFPGVEEEDELESSNEMVDKHISENSYRTILDTVHLDDMDDWENVEDKVRRVIADTLEAGRKYRYYRTSDETNETINKDWASHIPGLLQSMGLDQEQWDGMMPASKIETLASYMSWEEFDHYPEKINKAGLSELLGIDL